MDSVEPALRQSFSINRVPFAAAAIATPDKTLWSGGVGGVSPDSIFAIMSMTKAVTATAVLQLLEQGKVSLHVPASKYLPELAAPNVLTGFDGDGNPMLRPAAKPVTLHNLLTHTSGFVYDMWDQNLVRYNAIPAHQRPVAPVLAFEPGTRWHYGTGLDWVGRVVEAVSGQSLEDYCRQHILQRLGMPDTSFLCPPEKFDRLVTTSRRQSDGALKEEPRRQPPPPKSFNGGGGLFSTCTDYVKFMQMILHKGKGPGGERILQEKTIALMSANQIGDLNAGRLKTARPAQTADVDLHPGFNDKWTYAFLMNPESYTGGRSAGSLAWAGLENTFYWIDPARSLCAVLMMQFYPFVDPAAVAVLNDFERAVYRSV